MAHIAIIQIRGTIRVKPEVKYTLESLKLKRKNSCIVIENTPSYMGMIKVIKDYITYGEISEDTLKKLSKISKEGVAHLQPPRGGFERKGIKKPYTIGGALGKRDNIDVLISKMLPEQKVETN